MNKEILKIFLSYAHIDLGFAKRIYRDLKRYGLKIWFDKESLLPGQDWEKEIKKAIRESDYFIALLSDKSLSKRGFVHTELKFSFEIVEKYFPSDSGIFIIPVRLDGCKPSDAYERLGRLHWIDVFPQSEYKNGLRKILKVVSPGTLILRSRPKALNDADVHDMIKKHDFFDTSTNLLSKGFHHQYKELDIKGDKVIVDEFSCLMWQKGGSSNAMRSVSSKDWIKKLNRKGFAGFNDWRLPTLEEAMSLMEAKENDYLYIDPIFDSEQWGVWTADWVKGEWRAWIVLFDEGLCSRDYVGNDGDGYVRAVRSNL